MEVTKTIVSVVNSEQVSELAGDYDAAEIKEQFSTWFPYIANCTATVKIEDGVKYITFAEKLGTKG